MLTFSLNFGVKIGLTWEVLAGSIVELTQEIHQVINVVIVEPGHCHAKKEVQYFMFHVATTARNKCIYYETKISVPCTFMFKRMVSSLFY